MTLSDRGPGRTAKPLFIGSIPIAASNKSRSSNMEKQPTRVERPRRRIVPALFVLIVIVVVANIAFAQPPKKPVGGPADCAALKLAYAAAIKAGNGALVNQLGQELNAKGCYDQPPAQPSQPVLHYVVGGTQSVPFGSVGPSEGQSTVIRPGANPQCSAGALLISDDWVRPSNSIVQARDLSGKNADVVSVFDAPAHPEYYSYGTNDHDLIAMNDGSVLYLTGAFSKEPLATQPAWWNVAYRGNFGPGARSNLMVWRSTDCGAHFKYVGEMDPALMEDGSCANPQGSLDAAGHYDMGGSDGQLVKVDPASGTLYLTFRCVGNDGTADANGKFTLTSNALNKTLVASSTNNGVSWKSLGFINGVNWWRFGILPMGDRVAFGFANDVVFGKPSGGKLAFGKAQPLSGLYGGFNQTTSPFNPAVSPDPYVFSNVWGNTLIARAGDSQGLLLGFPSVIGSGASAANGYSVFFHDPKDSGTFSEMPAITPLTSTPTSYVMNVTAIDLGRGPVLLYWMDVNTASHKGRMRGRIIVSMGQYSSDFDISKDADFTVNANNYFPSSPLFFYGDYHTASGYIQQARAAIVVGSATSDIYHFYPIWVDRTGGARYAALTVTEGTQTGASAAMAKQLNISTIGRAQWKAPPPTIELLEFKGKLPVMRETIRGERERDRR
jgi:hypothetical protein